MQQRLTTNTFEALQQRNLDLLPRQTSLLTTAYRLLTEGAFGRTALRAETAAGNLTYNTVMDSHVNRLGSSTVARVLAGALALAVAAQ
jgi:hypothetical protein